MRKLSAIVCSGPTHPGVTIFMGQKECSVPEGRPAVSQDLCEECLRDYDRALEDLRGELARGGVLARGLAA